MERTFRQSLHEKLQMRQNLKELSNRLLDVAHKAGNVVISANYVLKVYYHRKGAHNLRTFNQWKNDGYAVRQGEKGFPIWGSPKKGVNKDGEEYTYSPMLFLFDESQVVKAN